MSLKAKPELVVVPVNIEKKQREELRAKKDKTGHSVSKIIRHLIEKYLNKV